MLIEFAMFDVPLRKGHLASTPPPVPYARDHVGFRVETRMAF